MGINHKRMLDKEKICTFEIANSLFAYDPDSGVITLKFNRLNAKRSIGDVATVDSHHGYLNVHYKGKLYRAHRVAYLLMTGAWPVGEIDHENLIRSDNSWLNLRLTSASGNHANKFYSNNKSGCKGVSWYARNGKWRVQIKKDGKVKHLCYTHCLEFAEFVYQEAARKYHGQFAKY